MSSQQGSKIGESHGDTLQNDKCPLAIEQAKKWRQFIADEVQRPSYFSMVMSKIEKDEQARLQKEAAKKPSHR